MSQLMTLDASYHGGVAAYIRNAQQLLKDSKEGGRPAPGREGPNSMQLELFPFVLP